MKIRKQGWLVTVCVLVSGAGAASAGDRNYPLSPVYKEECGSCHVAYPPALLPASSWRTVMAGLDRHFGSDASLNPAQAAEIARYLEAGAATRQKFEAVDADGQPLQRITDSAWFRREHRDGHDGMVAGVWKRPSVKTPANCAACHRNAGQGSYSESDIVIPRS